MSGKLLAERASGVVILLTSDRCLSSLRIFIRMVFSFEQRFQLEGGSIELHPLLVDRLRDLLSRNACRHQPFADRINCSLRRSKYFSYFLCRVISTILRRIMFGTGHGVRAELSVKCVSTHTSINRS
jgi:hypothetical protein